MTNQHPSLYSSARPRNTHHRTPVQSGAGQGLAYQGIRSSSGAQIPFLDYNVRRHTSVLNILIKLTH